MTDIDRLKKIGQIGSLEDESSASNALKWFDQV